MSDLQLRQGGEVARFDPAKTRTKLAMLDGQIVTARRLKDWPKLEQAAMEKVAEIENFVDNWDRHVIPVNQSVTLGGPISGTKTADVAETEWHISKQTVSRWREALRDVYAFLQSIIDGAYRRAWMEPDHRAMRNTGETEWFTPPVYIEAARAVMGGIDLDPATHWAAQERYVKADTFYTKVEDGLTRPWRGRVWLNPPYTNQLIGKFSSKLVAALSVGSVSEAIMLTNNCTDADWFHHAASRASLLCFTLGRISFISVNDEAATRTLQGQTFFYFGENTDRFSEIFNKHGFVLTTA